LWTFDCSCLTNCLQPYLNDLQKLEMIEDLFKKTFFWT